jgi:general secretion pathway protein G
MSRSFVISVIVLLCAVWYLVVPSTYSGAPPESFARNRIASFTTAVDLYHADLGRYPTTKEGLAVLPPLSHNPPAWRGPYLDGDKIPDDPWGRPYIYKCPGEHNTNGYDVYSLGASGKGGVDAIGNWPRP